MYPGIHNFSEIGKLNKVLLHRPGKELEALTPATLERLLFDDVPYLKIAQEEHDNFARVLRENGVEVVYYVDEVAKAIADPARQIQLVNDFLNISKIHAKGLRASMTSYLLNMPPKQMVAELIAGIKRSEVATKEATSLMDLVEDDYPFVSDPMPNLYFTRDPGACVGNGINIHRMHTPARKRESLLLKYMYLYNRDFATEENKQWYDLSDSYSIEGGDVLVLSKDIVAVGLSQRTTVSGAETFARNLLQNSGFKKVLAFDIPETRAFMHLDTVFTMVDYDKFTIHPEIEGPLSVYEMMLDEHGELKFAALKDELKEASDKLIMCTDDGTYGEKGFTTVKLKELLEKAKAEGKQYDHCICIGPLPMMKFVCQITKEYGVATMVDMNCIMIDGSGMCGGCRLTVDGKMKFTCVDGPEFDGHLVDFDEAIARSKIYEAQEQKVFERRHHYCNLQAMADAEEAAREKEEK